MRNKVQILLLLLFIGIAIQAQTPQLFKYQAVIRNSSGVVLENQSVELTMRIFQGSIDGTQVYSETHNVTTNSFGLVNLEIGSINTTDFAVIDWSNTPYFIELTIDGNVMGTSQLLSVPYALYANKAKEAENIFSGNYEDLNNSPDLSDTVNYLKNEVDPDFNQSLASKITENDTALWNNKSDFDGNYNNLSNIPDLSDTSNYIKTETDPIFINSVANSITGTDTLNWNHKSNFDGDYESLINKPQLFSGDYNDLLNQPDLSDTIKYLKYETDPTFLSSVASKISANDTAQWNHKSNFSGNYADLENLPDLSDTVNYIMSESDPVFNSSLAANITVSDTSSWNNKSEFSGNYEDLNNSPDLSDTSNYLKNEVQNLSMVLTNGTSASNNRIVDLADPLNDQDAATKAYVDILLQRIVKLEEEAGFIVVDADGNIYETARIGSQVWMAENLKTTKYNDNTLITNIDNQVDWVNATDGGYCWYNNDITNKDVYGALYNRYTVTSDKLCPSGWHVPTISEWDILEQYVSDNGYSGYESQALRDESFDGTNNFAFDALPGGRRNSAGTFENSGLESNLSSHNAYFWIYDGTTGSITLNRYLAAFSNGGSSVGTGISVRCIKD